MVQDETLALNWNVLFYVDDHFSGQRVQSFLSDSQWFPCPPTDWTQSTLNVPLPVVPDPTLGLWD